jgi:hypothetical protein
MAQPNRASANFGVIPDLSFLLTPLSKVSSDFKPLAYLLFSSHHLISSMNCHILLTDPLPSAPALQYSFSI